MLGPSPDFVLAGDWEVDLRGSFMSMTSRP